jgi:asparaginyl-tRNA synthetase
MDFVRISSILDGEHEGEEVRLRGWIYNKRSSGGLQFLILRDGTGVIQCVANRAEVGDETFNELDGLPVESALDLSGIVKRDPRAPDGYEVSVKNLGMIYRAQSGYPITKKYHGPEFLFDQRHLYIRDPKVQTILRMRSKFLEIARDWFRENGYTEAHSPSFITAACEGGSTLFEVKYFDQVAYLSQSWQLYAEATIATLGDIYTVAPSFRAERSRTRRHLAEYWHMEVERPWCDLEGIMKVGDELNSYVCRRLTSEMPRELKSLGRDPKDLDKVEPPFPRITYDEAVETLQKDGVEVKWGDDFDGRLHEEPLTRHFDRPFWVTYYPKGVKAFYHKPDPERPEVTLSADLLAPEGYGEIIGGGQRIHDYDELMQRVREENLNPEDYSWYLDLRRYGSVPHAGFGQGVERTLMWICKLSHIREAIAFPRMMSRVTP